MSNSNSNNPNSDQLKRRVDSLKHLEGFAEGDVFPLREKKIGLLVGVTEDYIVFLDEELNIEWANNEIEVSDRHATIKSEIIDLQIRTGRLFKEKHLRELRYSLATALAHSFEGNPNAAISAIKDVKKIVLDKVRIFYVIGSMTTSLVAFAIFMILYWFMDRLDLYDNSAMQVSMAGLAGSAGAFISVLAKREYALAGHAASLYVFDGCLRIVLGVIGATILVAAIKAGLLSGVLTVKGFSALLVVGALSGAIERIVPHLIDQIGIPNPATES